MGELAIGTQRKPSATFEDEQNQKLLLTDDVHCMNKFEKPVTEEELLRKEFVTLDDIKGLKTYPESYLCSKSANIYGIEFLTFAIRNYESGAVLFQLKTKNEEYRKNSTTKNQWSAETPSRHLRSPEYGDVENTNNEQKKINKTNSISRRRNQLEVDSISISPVNSEPAVDCLSENLLDGQIISDRHVCYNLPADILHLPTIGVTVEFKIGNKEIKNFRMIELHFFKDKLIKSFEFDFGFCIPNSVNCWEHIYEVPKLPSKIIREMINSPYETRSETYYFVDKRLVIHNKAKYAYNEGNETGWD